MTTRAPQPPEEGRHQDRFCQGWSLTPRRTSLPTLLACSPSTLEFFIIVCNSLQMFVIPICHRLVTIQSDAISRSKAIL